MCCLQGFKLWQRCSCLWEAASAGFEKGFGTFTLDLLFSCFRFPEATACWQLLCCDAPACLMAELPGCPAGVWCSPVRSWVSVKPCPQCSPTSHLGSDRVVAVTNPVMWAASCSPYCALLALRTLEEDLLGSDGCMCIFFNFWCAWETVSSGKVAIYWMGRI